MTHDTMHWEKILSDAGYRVTRQRSLILDAVCAGDGHTSFSEIYGRVRRTDRSIDRSTVYRALHLFVEVGIVVPADTGGDEIFYEVAKREFHHHLVCRSCDRQWEISDSALQAMLREIRREYGFQVATDHLVLFGECADCRLSDQHETRGDS